MARLTINNVCSHSMSWKDTKKLKQGLKHERNDQLGTEIKGGGRRCRNEESRRQNRGVQKVCPKGEKNRALSEPCLDERYLWIQGISGFKVSHGVKVSLGERSIWVRGLSGFKVSLGERSIWVRGMSGRREKLGSRKDRERGEKGGCK